MAERFDACVENLRKRSRLLLARVEETSKQVKRLHSQSLPYSDFKDTRCPYSRRHSELWKLRNDSSGVGGVLCPNYFQLSPRCTRSTASVPEMLPPGKILIASKKCSPDRCIKNLFRKPVKECYCAVELNRVRLRSSRTQYKPTIPCDYCKTHFEVLPAKAENIEKKALTPPLSCETLRKVQRIDYTPRSQFLRNVQSKISVLQDVPREESPVAYPKSTRRRESVEKVQIAVENREDAGESQSKTASSKSIRVDRSRKHDGALQAPEDSVTEEDVEEEEQEEYRRHETAQKSDKGVQVLSKKQPKAKTVIKKTISSKKSVPEEATEKPAPIPPDRNKGLANVDCPCCCRCRTAGFSKANLDRDLRKYRTCPECCRQTKWSMKREDRAGDEIDERLEDDQDVRNLRKFREQNYFDTHGSCQTLVSSESSGSLRQYLLNERLFPEPVRRIHKEDLVVTMPPCATKQRKRIHYFPRYIVRQEKSTHNAGYKKRRCQSCPLTGHAIDLGVLKYRPPTNSLALKYQKRTP